MKKALCLLFAVLILILIPAAHADYVVEYHDDSYHPYHHHHRHYNGGYVYCNVCNLYHYPDHHHFYHPPVVEHHTDVQSEYVAQTREVVE